MTQNPKISVCLATYNGGNFIKEQLNSILIQLPQNSEIIISDDGSTDCTLSIAREFDDSRIRVIANRKQSGVIGNFENAITYAKGRYIYLSDQDDLWHQDKIQKTITALELHMLICHDCVLIDENGNTISDSLFSMNHGRPGILKNLTVNSYTGCCMAFRRELLEYALPFPKDIYMHDVWLGIIADIYGTVSFNSNSLVSYRRHNNTITNTGEKSRNSVFTKIIMRVRLLKSLVYRVSIIFLKKYINASYNIKQ